MTIAEIRGKISETGSNLSERMEDLLTSDVFGCLRYLPAEKGLIPFLDTARSYRDKALNLPLSATKIRYLFWPYLKTKGCNPCEPDVLLGVETDQGLNLVMIEAKYYSGLSSEEDGQDQPNNQLARELDNLNVVTISQLGWPPDLCIVSRSLLFITKDMKIPVNLLSQSLAEYQSKRGDEGDIFWTSWRFLPAILEKRIASESNQEHRAVLEDMMLLLQRKWLTMFNGVEPVFHEFNKRDFDFYHISSLKLNWPDLTGLRQIDYSYGLPENTYEWPDMPELKMNYEYGRR